MEIYIYLIYINYDIFTYNLYIFFKENKRRETWNSSRQVASHLFLGKEPLLSAKAFREAQYKAVLVGASPGETPSTTDWLPLCSSPSRWLAVKGTLWNRQGSHSQMTGM